MTKPKDRSPAMQFYFKKFYGDDAVILMDLDAVGAHILLMCFAGASKEGYRIENNDEILKKILRGVGTVDWVRIKPQIMTAWDISDDGKWIIQRGMQRTLLKQKEFSKKQTDRIKARWKDTGRVPDGIPDGYSTSTSTSTSINNNITKSNIIKNSPKKARIIAPKIQHGEFVFLSEAEHQKLLTQFDDSFVRDCIDKLNSWIGSEPTPKRKTNGKNAAYTFRSWVINSIQKEQTANKFCGNGYHPHTAAATVEHNIEYYRKQNEPINIKELLDTLSEFEEKPKNNGIGGSGLVPSAKRIIG